MNDSQNMPEEIKDERVHMFDKPENVQRLIRGFFVCCALLLIADLLFHRHLSFAEGVMPVEGWFGFYAFYGFVACVLLVLAAKQMRKVLMRSEDYYDG
jgi:hypothetical protein